MHDEKPDQTNCSILIKGCGVRQSITWGPGHVILSLEFDYLLTV